MTNTTRDKLIIVRDILLGYRLPVFHEFETQAAIAKVLSENHVAFVREFPLGRGPIDFYLPGDRIGIEVKIKGSPAAVVQQVMDYLEDEQIGGIILATAKPSLGNLPGEMMGKPVLIAPLWKWIL